MYTDEINEIVIELNSKGDWLVYGCAMFNLIKDWDCTESELDCSECPINSKIEIERKLRELYC